MTRRMCGRTLVALVLTASAAARAQDTRETVAAPASPPPGSPDAAIVVDGPPARTVSLDEAVTLALRLNQDIRSSAAEVDAADAARRQVKGTLFPRLRADANVFAWNKALELSVGPGAPPVVVREMVTSTITVQLIQPVSGLVALLDAYELRKIGVDAASLRADIRKREVTLQTVEAFYRARQAARLLDVARRSIEQLDAQVKRARTLETRGVVGRSDVLKAEVAAANAQQRMLQATTGLSIAQARLAFVLGGSGEVAAAPSGVPSDPAPIDIRLDDAQRRAQAQRAELRELDARLAQAAAAVRVARARLFPQINAVGAYQHNEGLGFVQPKNAAYFGALLTWDAWDWGATPAGIGEARALETQTLAAADKVKQAIALEVRSSYMTAVTTHAALGVARKTLEQAEESLRLETKRYEGGAATSLEVLDAETTLTQARAQLETALYDYLIARASLRKGMGDSPLETSR